MLSGRAVWCIRLSVIHHNFKRRIADAFSRGVASYNQHAALQRMVAAQTAEIFRTLAAPGSLTLDAGCGTGFISQSLPHDYSANIISLDISEAMCRTARVNNGGNAAVLADMEALPFKDSTFSGVVSSLALQWADAERFFHEAYRVLGSGGIAVASTLIPPTFNELDAVLNNITGHSRVRAFKSTEYYSQACLDAGFLPFALNTVNADGGMVRQEIITEHDSVRSILKNLKSTGAYASEAAVAPLSRAKLKALEAEYTQNYAPEGKLRLSWHVLYLAMRKL